MTEQELIVIGGGPGGYTAAFLAADRGMKITLINDSDRPGGTCLHVGCIPSKALLHAAKLITESREASAFGIHFGEPRIDLDGVRGAWTKIVEKLANNVAGLGKRRKVNYIHGRARFLDGETIEVSDGSTHRFRHCVLATGSVPIKPASLWLDSPRLMTSTEALRLEGIPGPLLVIGGGYIGLELGFVWAALGSPVTVVEMMDGLLPGADRDLVRPLQDRLAKMFRHVYLSTQVTRLEETEQGIRAYLKGDNLEDPAPVFEKVLVAVGRKPASQNLGLEKAGVAVNDKGFVKIDRKCRTTAERIFAVGDVAGEPMLAHKASHEARVAIEVIAGEPAELDYRCIPAVVFTDPELAWCGLTESEAKKTGRAVEVARYPWAASGRAETLHRTEGLTKLIVDPGTDQLLGVGIVGPGAGEMIAEAALAIEMGATARDLELTIHAHPTLSETLMEASELLHGSATHLYRPRRG